MKKTNPQKQVETVIGHFSGLSFFAGLSFFSGLSFLRSFPTSIHVEHMNYLFLQVIFFCKVEKLLLDYCFTCIFEYQE